MQTDNPVARRLRALLNECRGRSANLCARKSRSMVKARMEKLAAEFDFVPRDEFEAVKAMAARARAENDKLGLRLKDLEAKIESRQRPAHRAEDAAVPGRAKSFRVRRRESCELVVATLNPSTTARRAGL